MGAKQSYTTEREITSSHINISFSTYSRQSITQKFAHYCKKMTATASAKLQHIKKIISIAIWAGGFFE